MKYNKLMDALNLIDEQADRAPQDDKETIERMRAYNIIATFINKYTKK
jgi:hypothetical protein